ncbi:MAG: hypothetical protein M1824_002123 [Vezdaea acicularis]|nr:MAG: hypothetical protein M1824_002123 [Vezdaea acicularis]
MLFSRLVSWAWLMGSAVAAISRDENNDVKSIPVSERLHLSPPYLDTDMQSRWFDFGGSTIVRADRYIRLTSAYQSQTGYIFSRIPLTATNWEIEVEFAIHGPGTLNGDGLAMWITKQRATQGTVFGSTDRFEGLGVFIDTYKNNRPGVVFPYVMAMVGDGQTNYDKANDGKSNELAGCSARGIRNSESPTKMRLTYYAEHSLTLMLQYKSSGEWTECFNTGPITLPQVAYLGFSAETGELTDNHDILKVTTKNLYAFDAKLSQADRKAGAGPGKGKSGSSDAKKAGWGWWFIKVILVVVACGAVYIGYTVWRTQQRSKSRF